MIQKLHDKRLINPPKWLPNSVHYETMMGSYAYGVNKQDKSDIDIYGFCIPPLDMMFPHLRGEIPGFGRQLKRFDQYQEHHVKMGKQEFDLSIYSIVKYFDLCMNNNPNMIDSLFTAKDCVLKVTEVGNMVKDARHLFLHKGSWPKFRGYANSQVHKMTTKTLQAFIELEASLGIQQDTTIDDVLAEYGRRQQGIEVYQIKLEHVSDANLQKYHTAFLSLSKRQRQAKLTRFDLKFAYHVVRLMREAEQILVHHDIDLRRDREELKAVRRGEKTVDDILEFFDVQSKHLDELYYTSTLRDKPPEDALRQLLLNCIEHTYGSISNAVTDPTKADKALDAIQAILDKHKG